MYGQIEKAYGIKINNESDFPIDSNQEAFLRALLRETDPFLSAQDADMNEVMFQIRECDFSFWNELYSGGGRPATFIGVPLKTWAYWELEGPEGIIASAKIDDPTESEVRMYEKAVPKYVKDLMASFNISPSIIWLTSTS